MKIINQSSTDIVINDIDRGLNNEIYESWNGKGYNVVPAGGYIHVLDTEKVMLSREMGTIYKLTSLPITDNPFICYLDVLKSITNRNIGPFVLPLGGSIEFTCGGNFVGVSFLAGTYTAQDIIDKINTFWTNNFGYQYFAFKATISTFFRSSNMTKIVNGERVPSILNGFISMESYMDIIIGTGDMNFILGFHVGEKTLAG